MSRSVDIFIKSSASFEEVLQLLQRITGNTFSKNSSVSWNLYNLQIFETDIALFESDFDDNLGIEFSKYQFVVSISVWNTFCERYKYQWVTSFPIVLAKIIHQESGSECIVVDDMQTLVESFKVGKT
jgi:hypothetical protein